MTPSKYLCALLFNLACLSSLSAQQNTSTPAPAPSGTQMLTVGDPGNAPDDHQHGHVGATYQIGAYEWTVQDWTTMLNDVASKPDPLTGLTDPHGLWNPGMSRWIIRSGEAVTGYVYSVVAGCGKLPITNVNLYDCARACNYTQNKTKLPLASGISMDSITEHGSYKITVNANGVAQVILQNNAQYAIPTQDQWVKAAYYKGGSLNAGYWMYPTRCDTNPGDSASSTLNNRANYDLYPDFYWAPALILTDVDHCGKLGTNDTFVGTYSPYGCFDMAGNVNEWTSTTDGTGKCIVRGGAYDSEYYMAADNYLMRTCPPQTFYPETRSNTIGFRMAARNLSNDSSLAADTSNNEPANGLTTGEEEALTLAPVFGAVLVGSVWFLGLDAILTTCITAGEDDTSEAATTTALKDSTERNAADSDAHFGDNSGRNRSQSDPTSNTTPGKGTAATETSDTPLNRSSSNVNTQRGTKTPFMSPQPQPGTVYDRIQQFERGNLEENPMTKTAPGRNPAAGDTIPRSGAPVENTPPRETNLLQTGTNQSPAPTLEATYPGNATYRDH